MNKYLIKIKCDKQGLAEILAAAIDSEANIEIDYEAIKENKPVVVRENVDVPPPLTTAPAFDCSYKHPPKPKIVQPYSQKLRAWDLYEMLWQQYANPNQRFKMRDAYRLQALHRFDATKSSVSAHLTRMSAVGLVNRVDGSKTTGGFVYELTADKLAKKKFSEAISRYDRRVKSKERQRSEDQTRWYNLGKLQAGIRV
jgi:DNA-binding MarR family transcriptional regulator